MNRVYRISALILLLVLLVSCCQAQTADKKPLLLVFTGVIVKEKEQKPKKKPSKKAATTVPAANVSTEPSKPFLMTCDPAISAEVISQIEASGKLDIINYNPEHASIQRAIMEKRIKQEAADNPADEKNVYIISKALGADFALRIQGSITFDKIDIALEMIDARKMQKWASSSGSAIQVTDGPRAQASRKDAIFNASSTAVSQVLILALGQKELLKVEPYSPVSDPPTADVTVIRDIRAEVAGLLLQADTSIEKNDPPSAIYAIRRAINLDPGNTDLRIRLAELYLSLKLTNKAIEEYRNAAHFNKSDERIYNQLVAIFMKAGKFDEAVSYLEEAIRINPKNVDALLNLGDLYWNLSRINESEKAYVDASGIAPGNSAAHEKLYKLYYAKREFDKAFPQRLLSKQMAAGDESEDSRYHILSEIIKGEYVGITGKLRASRVDFDKQVISREDYYQECKAAVKEIDAFSNFASKEKVPAKVMAAHSHAMLALNLLSQECGSMVSYFETEKRHYLDQSDVFSSEAQNEMDAYEKELAKP